MDTCPRLKARLPPVCAAAQVYARLAGEAVLVSISVQADSSLPLAGHSMRAATGARPQGDSPISTCGCSDHGGMSLTEARV